MTTKTKTKRATKKALGELVRMTTERCTQKQAEFGCPAGRYATIAGAGEGPNAKNIGEMVGCGYDRWSRDSAMIGAINDMLAYAHQSGRLFCLTGGA